MGGGGRGGVEGEVKGLEPLKLSLHKVVDMRDEGASLIPQGERRRHSQIDS